jgi:hypothetical protein
MVGQASSLSVEDDGQDARPTGNLLFCRLGDCFAPLAMTFSDGASSAGSRTDTCLHRFELFSLNCVAECGGLL